MSAEEEDYSFPSEAFLSSQHVMQAECEHPAHSVSDSAQAVFASRVRRKSTSVSLQTRRVGSSTEFISRIWIGRIER